MRKLIAAAVVFGTAGLFVPAIARAHFNADGAGELGESEPPTAIRRRALPAVRPIRA